MNSLWRTSYQDCLDRLAAASRGELDLGLDEDGVTAAGPDAGYRNDALETDRVYDREKMDKF